MKTIAYTKRAPRKSYSKLAINLPPPPLAMQPSTGVRTRAVEFLDRFVSHPGFGLEPKTVVSIYRTAEMGFPMQQCDMFDDLIENDGHLRSLIETRTLAVAGKQWQIASGGEDDVSIEAARVLEEALRESNFDDLIAHLLGARYYGWAGSEIVWRDVDGDTLPRHFVNVPCRRFNFDEFDQPRLINDFGDSFGEELMPGKWIFAKNNSGSGLTSRAGLMRTASWYSLFKRWSWRDWVVYGEKYGIPLVVGKHEHGATPEDIDAVEDAVTNIGEDGQAVMSDNAQIEIHEAKRGGGSEDLHRSIVNESNREMSKLITGSTLTIDQGGTGSFALGKVHETRAFDLVVADAQFIGKLFRNFIARPMLRFNSRLDGAQIPRLTIHIARELDPQTRAGVLQTLQAMGVQLDIEQIREEFQVRAPVAGRELAAPTPAPGSAPPESD